MGGYVKNVLLVLVAVFGLGACNHKPKPLRVVKFETVTTKGYYNDTSPACEATARNEFESVTARKDYESCEHISIGDIAEHSGSDVWINGDLYKLEQAEMTK
jgi:hypothetical protein